MDGARGDGYAADSGVRFSDLELLNVELHQGLVTPELLLGRQRGLAPILLLLLLPKILLLLHLLLLRAATGRGGERALSDKRGAGGRLPHRRATSVSPSSVSRHARTHAEGGQSLGQALRQVT